MSVEAVPALGDIAVVAVTALGVVMAAIVAAMVALTAHVARQTARMHRLWLYTRQLVDHIYRGSPPPPPPPPADLFT